MTREGIIRMAREAGMQGMLTDVVCTHDELVRFAEIVRADERSACLDVIESHRIPVGNSAAGELACAWTYEALKEIKAIIQARGTHEDRN